MSDIDLDAIRKRLFATTSGPWTTGADEAWSDALAPWALVINVNYPLIELQEGAQGVADAEFIAHARTDVPALLYEVDLLQAEVDRERGKVGDLVRKLNDITRGQGEVWPAGASLPAGPPLPRRTPMQAAFEVGEFPAIVQPAPMTDPALEDRTEGSEP